MTSDKPIQEIMFNSFLSSLPVTEVPVDEGGDVVVGTMSANALRIDTRCDVAIVSLAGRCRVLLAARVIDGLVGGMIGVCVDMLTELDIVVAAAIALEVFVTPLCVGDVRAGVWTGTVIDMDLINAVRVDVVVRVLIDLVGFSAVIGVGVLADVDANTLASAMTDLEFINMWASLEDSLRFC